MCVCSSKCIIYLYTKALVYIIVLINSVRHQHYFQTKDSPQKVGFLFSFSYIIINVRLFDVAKCWSPVSHAYGGNPNGQQGNLQNQVRPLGTFVGNKTSHKCWFLSFMDSPDHSPDCFLLFFYYIPITLKNPYFSTFLPLPCPIERGTNYIKMAF